jgi:hypothetical protein
MIKAHVYELRGQPDKYPGFLQVFENYATDPERWKEHMAMRCIAHGAAPFGDDYTPVPLEFHNEGRKKNTVGDICLSMQPFIIFSDKAQQVLDIFLQPIGEFLKVAAPVPGFIGYRTLKRLEGDIDLEKSIYTTADNGKVLVRKPTMYESKVRGLDIFSIPEMPSSIFVSQAFKDAVVKAKLKGFDLSKEIPLV